MIFRKLYPVIDWQSFLTQLNKFRTAFFSDVNNTFANRIYLLIRDSVMCLVLLNGSIKYLWVSLGNANIILWKTFHVFSSFSVALLNKFHNDESVKFVLKMLLIQHLVFGCANENSCKSSLFLAIYCALFSAVSWLISTTLLTMVLPRCFTYSTHGSFLPHSVNSFRYLFLCKNAIHFILLFLGSSFVLKVKLCSEA